jgi:hypothetical protein
VHGVMQRALPLAVAVSAGQHGCGRRPFPVDAAYREATLLHPASEAGADWSAGLAVTWRAGTAMPEQPASQNALPGQPGLGPAGTLAGLADALAHLPGLPHARQRHAAPAPERDPYVTNRTESDP